MLLASKAISAGKRIDSEKKGNKNYISSEVRIFVLSIWDVGYTIQNHIEYICILFNCRIDPSLRYFSFQPGLNDWYNKRRGMCYPICGIIHI